MEPFPLKSTRSLAATGLEWNWQEIAKVEFYKWIMPLFGVILLKPQGNCKYFARFL